MNDESLERLLRGYRLPDAPSALDRRVLARAEGVLARARMRGAAATVAREFANAFGFGYLNYVVDLVTATDAEYHVDLI
jgi:hypothetical protein